MGKFQIILPTKLVTLDCVRGRKRNVKEESLKEDKCPGKESEEKEPEPSSHCLMITHGAAHESLIIYLKENGDVLRIPSYLVKKNIRYLGVLPAFVWIWWTKKSYDSVLTRGNES